MAEGEDLEGKLLQHYLPGSAWQAGRPALPGFSAPDGGDNRFIADTLARAFRNSLQIAGSGWGSPPKHRGRPVESARDRVRLVLARLRVPVRES